MGLLPIPTPRLTQGASRAGFWRAAALYDKRLPPPSFRLPHVGLETCETSALECRGYRFGHYRPCPGFLLFLSFRFLRCRLVSLTSVLKDTVSAADSSFNKPPWCVCPVLVSSLSELLEVYGPIPRGAGSPHASPNSSSLSMGTIPKDDRSALVSFDSDPDPPLNPTVVSDPHDECGATC